jgi:hypothetical protein
MPLDQQAAPDRDSLDEAHARLDRAGIEQGDLVPGEVLPFLQDDHRDLQGLVICHGLETARLGRQREIFQPGFPDARGEASSSCNNGWPC